MWETIGPRAGAPVDVDAVVGPRLVERRRAGAHGVRARRVQPEDRPSRCSPTRARPGPRSARGGSCRPGRIRPGKTWTYSNTNYLLLGELVEAVTGRPLADGDPRRGCSTRSASRHAWYQAAEEPQARRCSIGYRLGRGDRRGARAVPVARRATSCRSGPSSPRPAARARSPRRPRTRRAGCRRSRAARCCRRRCRRR